MTTSLVSKTRTQRPAEHLRLEIGSDQRLWATTGGKTRPVYVQRCFPWSEAERYLSLRDEDENEVALVRDPAQLDPDSRVALEWALQAAGFVFEIVAVLEIEEEVEIRNWQVMTRQGERRFQTRLDDWPVELPDGGRLVRDVTGDLYRLGDPEALDPKSRRLLWALVD